MSTRRKAIPWFSIILLTVAIALAGCKLKPTPNPTPPGSEAIVGTWSGGDTMKRGFYVMTFFSDGTYVIADDDDSTTNTDPDHPVCQAGIEHGIYTWDPVTGAFSANPTLTDTNGECGFSTGDGMGSKGGTITISGDTLTMDGGKHQLQRLVPDAGNPIVGSWYRSHGWADSFSVTTFFADGTYVQASDGDSGIDPSGHDGMEHGTYTLNPTTGAFTSVASLADTDGEWGLSNPGGAPTVTISNNTLTFNVANAEPASLTRLVP